MYFLDLGWSWLDEVMIGGFNDSEKSGKQMLTISNVDLKIQRFIQQNHKYLMERASRKNNLWNQNSNM